MHTPQMKKISLFENYASMRASPEKYYKENQTTKGPESILKTNSSSNLKTQSSNFNDPEKTMI